MNPHNGYTYYHNDVKQKYEIDLKMFETIAPEINLDLLIPSPSTGGNFTLFVVVFTLLVDFGLDMKRKEHLASMFTFSDTNDCNDCNFGQNAKY